jgi:hypothetical protein
MAKESFQLDPNAVVYTDDEIVGKVNSATANISRAGSVEAAARPIESGEGADVRDAILALPDVDRKLIITDPQSGEKPVLALQKDADGKLDIDNDDQPIP